MRVPLKLSAQSPLRKFVAAGVISLAACALALLAARAPGVSTAVGMLDNVLYDSLYHLRPVQSQREGPVVIVAVDDGSLTDLAHGMVGKTHYGWPWPRQFWGVMIDYFNKCGAKAVAIDLLTTEPSVYNDVSGDDGTFAKAVERSKIPVVFASIIAADGTPGEFAPPVKKPVLGAANVGADVVFRRYTPTVNGVPSLAARTVASVGGTPFTEPFLLHYYGPHVYTILKQDGGHATERTFKYLSASHVLGTGINPKIDYQVRPEMFRDKIVVIGTITAGTFDLKSSPLSAEYPGVEVQATAMTNMLAGQRVERVSAPGVAGAGFVFAFMAAAGVAFPRRATLKLAAAALAILVLVTAAALMFKGHQIRWLPLAAPLIAVVLATVVTFAWSYMTEGRQRRFVVKALGQYLSPEVAASIDRDPDALKLGGTRREMTVMFTDIQGFTDLSERLGEHQLTSLLNYYLDEMSSLVLDNAGTLDKYIGDAIMSFWNAPLHQPDHALLACRAALAMEKREAEIQPQLEQMGATGLLTRIGINTGPMVFGNMGSSQKFNYSVLGDSVNLASRLEGANKFYGSRILIAQPTAEQVKDHFLLRKLDVLRVKGKVKPMAVFEVLGEAGAGGDLAFRAAEYEAAFVHYQQQKWDDTAARLQSILARFPQDRPAAALAERVAYLRQHPPGADWDGVYVAKGK